MFHEIWHPSQWQYLTETYWYKGYVIYFICLQVLFQPAYVLYIRNNCVGVDVWSLQSAGRSAIMYRDTFRLEEGMECDEDTVEYWLYPTPTHCDSPEETLAKVYSIVSPLSR